MVQIRVAAAAVVLLNSAAVAQTGRIRQIEESEDSAVTHAEELGVASDQYSVWGSSAGARMAASVGSHGTAAFGAGEHPRPAAVVMAYTGHSDLSSDEPPTFVVVGGRDAIAPPAAMERRIAALRSGGTEVEYHVYPSLGHGFGAGTGTEAEGWIGKAVAFWARQVEASKSFLPRSTYWAKAAKAANPR